MAYDDDRDELEPAGVDENGRPVVKHVIRALASAVKIKQADHKARAEEAKAAARMEMAKTQAEERRRKDELRAEIAKLRLKMTAKEAASKHIAIFGPLYLMLLVGMFLLTLGTGMIETDQVPVVSALLTLLVTMIGANLRSIVSESNGHDDEKKKKTERDPDDE